MAPWAFGPVEFTVPGGEPSLVELAVPPRGTIHSFRCLQTAGDVDATTLRLFQSEAAAQLAIAGGSDSVAPITLEPDAYSVFGSKSLTDGRLVEDAKEYPYRNQDGRFSAPVERLWLVIEPAGTGDKTFVLSMTITSATR